jgi:nucleoside-diphosphate-sugar epimerase
MTSTRGTSNREAILGDYFSTGRSLHPHCIAALLESFEAVLCCAVLRCAVSWRAMRRLRVLVTGGSGYLGQHLIVGLLKAGHDVGFTYMSSQLSVPVRAEPFRVDLASGQGLQAAVCGWRPHVIINCAAISQPAACEHDEAACNAVNVPTRLVEELQALRSEPGGHAALLIHISTDQVGGRVYVCVCAASPSPPNTHTHTPPPPPYPPHPSSVYHYIEWQPATANQLPAKDHAC